MMRVGGLPPGWSTCGGEPVSLWWSWACRGAGVPVAFQVAQGLGTLLSGLLTHEEERDRANVFDMWLARRAPGPGGNRALSMPPAGWSGTGSSATSRAGLALNG